MFMKGLPVLWAFLKGEFEYQNASQSLGLWSSVFKAIIKYR